MSRRVFLGLTSIKQRIKCLAHGYNTVASLRLEPNFVVNSTNVTEGSTNFVVNSINITEESTNLQTNDI